MIIVDASIAAKWYLKEAGSEEAAEILTSSASTLIAPALIRLEVNGAILRRYRDGMLSPGLAKQACELWDADLASGVLRLIPDESLIAHARKIAFEIRHALQDCLYLAAAVETGSTSLITADPTFHRRTVPSYPIVELRASSMAR
jgi:predicted nucleic acid-binding protein